MGNSQSLRPLVSLLVSGCRFVPGSFTGAFRSPAFRVSLPGPHDLPSFARVLGDHRLGCMAAAGLDLVVSGDLNVARSDQDVHPKERKPRAIGQLPVEREMFEEMLAAGVADVGRKLYPDDDNYFTWWAPWRQMRERNIGWRIDYILASPGLADRAVACPSYREIGTSDHAPVIAELK